MNQIGEVIVIRKIQQIGEIYHLSMKEMFRLVDIDKIKSSFNNNVIKDNQVNHNVKKIKTMICRYFEK